VRGRLLASLLAGALAIGGAAGAGWGEPGPADRIIPVGAPPLAAGLSTAPDSPPAASPLRAVEGERATPPAAPEASLGSSVDSSAPAASIERAAAPLTPAGGLADIRSKP
jgi:hypothetical protein